MNAKIKTVNEQNKDELRSNPNLHRVVIMNKPEWSRALRSLAQTQRRQHPVPSREHLSAEEEWQCRLIGGAFIRWYQQQLRDILAQRTALRLIKFDARPLIVFTTTMPGLVAAQEILAEPAEGVVALLHTEYEAWEQDHPVDAFTFHIHHWNYFGALDQDLLARAGETYPTVDADALRLQSTGYLWAEQSGAFADHLWRWDGHEMALLEEGFVQGVY